MNHIMASPDELEMAAFGIAGDGGRGAVRLQAVACAGLCDLDNQPERRMYPRIRRAGRRAARR
jgi:hypothetical protein